MIAKIIKAIASVFFAVVALILFFLWLLVGTLLLIALLIRLIALYTIALLNSFVSGTPLIHDYTKAIEEVIDMYLNTYVKIINMPKLPWIPIPDSDTNTLRALLSTELAELKKSWIITVIVFLSYICSFGFGIAILIHVDNNKAKKKFESEINLIKRDFQESNKKVIELESILLEYNEDRIKTISILYCEKRYSVKSIARFLNVSQDVVRKIIKEQKLKR